ncbi:hypothetical protein F5Y15DRAFT_430112 [Xylariaceae sp. FL0016]|nr:hypothetical protein F5Y15DRAFT_430112 [Xylariaceae sp. FL0016]
MSYSYPAPSHTGAEMDMSQAGYLSSYPATTSSMEVRSVQQVHPAPPPPPPPPPVQLPAPLPPPSAYPAPAIHIPSLAQRRESLSKAFKLKRSLSTPNVRPQGMSDSDSGPLGLHGDKKRNKLGYHRTPIACGNCRKRKIRCQPRKDDGRCEQCIRLKKDCSFYPVDQQPPPAAGLKATARSAAGSKLASASASPAVALGHSADTQAHSYHQLSSMPSIHNMGPPPLKSEPYPEDHKIHTSPTNTRSFSYSQGMPNWVPPEPSPSSAKAPGDTWRNYPHESPVTPAYSPYTPQPSQSSTAWAAPLGAPIADSTSRPEDAWSSYPQPSRSMSYGGEPSGHYTASSRPLERRPSMATDLYHPPITSTIDTVTGTAFDPRGSLSAGAVPPASYGTWQQPYQGWYGDSGHPASSGADHTQAAAMYYGGGR